MLGTPSLSVCSYPPIRLSRVGQIRSLSARCWPLTEGDDGPRGVESNVIDPEIEKLGSTVRHAVETLLSPVSSIVQGHSVEVGDTDDDLEEVSGRVVGADAENGDEAQWSPDELDERVR